MLRWTSGLQKYCYRNLHRFFCRPFWLLGDKASLKNDCITVVCIPVFRCCCCLWYTACFDLQLSDLYALLCFCDYDVESMIFLNLIQELEQYSSKCVSFLACKNCLFIFVQMWILLGCPTTVGRRYASLLLYLSFTSDALMFELAEQPRQTYVMCRDLTLTLIHLTNHMLNFTEGKK